MVAAGQAWPALPLQNQQGVGGSPRLLTPQSVPAVPCIDSCTPPDSHSLPIDSSSGNLSHWDGKSTSPGPQGPILVTPGSSPGQDVTRDPPSITLGFHNHAAATSAGGMGALTLKPQGESVNQVSSPAPFSLLSQALQEENARLKHALAGAEERNTEARRYACNAAPPSPASHAASPSPVLHAAVGGVPPCANRFSEIRIQPDLAPHFPGSESNLDSEKDGGFDSDSDSSSESSELSGFEDFRGTPPLPQVPEFEAWVPSSESGSEIDQAEGQVRLPVKPPTVRVCMISSEKDSDKKR
jgi:hypothetical protein